MSKLVVHTQHAPKAIGPYSQAIRVNDIVFISGQIPIDPETNELISSTIQEETHRVMKNLRAILEQAGMDLSNVVKTSIFLKTMDDFAAVNEVYATYFSGDFPARETVAVAGLPKGARVEISVIASL
ncbi:MAG: RidA family protein [Chitinophagales bacterium]